MAVDGTWKLVVNTPMGAQESTLVVQSSGGTLTGTAGMRADEAGVPNLAARATLGLFRKRPQK